MNKVKQLENIREKAVALSLEQDKLVNEALQITGELCLNGFTFDYVLNDFCTAEELLERFDKTVE